jgi:acetoin utilization deacetylase AcuC-like enzyme
LTTFENYEPALLKAIQAIKSKGCGSMIVSFGLDTADGDPLGTFKLKADDYFEIGKCIFTQLYGNDNTQKRYRKPEDSYCCNT